MEFDAGVEAQQQAVLVAVFRSIFPVEDLRCALPVDLRCCLPAVNQAGSRKLGGRQMHGAARLIRCKPPSPYR